MVFDEPINFLDIQGITAFEEGVKAAKNRGQAVLVVSHDLDELFEISHRLAVLSGGRLSEALPTRDMTVEQAGLLMGGADAGHAGQTASEGSHAA